MRIPKSMAIFFQWLSAITIATVAYKIGEAINLEGKYLAIGVLIAWIIAQVSTIEF